MLVQLMILSFLPQRPNIHVDTPFTNLREENDTPISLHVSPLEPSTHRDITNDVLIFPDPPIDSILQI